MISLKDKDLPLALVGKRLLQAMGYLVDLKVPYYAHSYGRQYKRTDITDIDLLGIKFDLDFASRTAVGECKSTEAVAVKN